MAERCRDCEQAVILEGRGNGKCRKCQGRGTRNTIVNDVTGVDTKCDACGGTGACATCRGSGRVEAVKAAVKEEKPKATPREPDPVSLSELERSWYHLCNSSDFIPDDRVEYFVERLKAAREHAAIVVGLHDFTGETCPKCGSRGHFKIHFLGNLRHPGCGASWYMGPGGYAAFQLGQVFKAGASAGGSIKEDSDRKGEGAAGWMGAIFGFLFVAVFRAALALVLIPVQIVVSLSQSKPGKEAAKAAGGGQ